jgi:hypothetical protein
MSYQDAALKAKTLVRKNGDSEDLRLAVGEAIKESPTDADRDMWRSVADKLAQGLSVKTKELDQ